MKNILFAVIIAVAGCNTNSQKQTTKAPDTKQKKQTTIVDIQVKANKQGTITIGEIIEFNYKVKKLTPPDSIKLSIGTIPYKTFKGNEALLWDSKNAKTGSQQLLFNFYWADTLSASNLIQYRVLSNIEPKYFTYSVKNKWDHNNKAYTQGLEFSEGYLYEGTGNYGESMLFKLDLDKNEIIQSINLSEDLFGEGITIMGDKIYQLTWRSNVGYVYNKDNLVKLYDFSYPTEGWGLTNNGKELIMSDGSENIYFLDTEFMQETKRLQVYNNKGPIKHLNELEFIDGIIYANVYGSYEIVAFDAQTGKVLKSINLEGILDKTKLKKPVDVLNGIAWDKENQRMIVTGKWWPYFYEIELIASTKHSNP